ncbi:MAG: 30S ribosomal protein S15 [archaeon]
MNFLAVKEEKTGLKAQKKELSVESEAHSEAKHVEAEIKAKPMESVVDAVKEHVKEEGAKKHHKAKGKKEGKKGIVELVEYKPKEIEEVIINLANSGHTPAQVGMILRDQYGVPNAKKVLCKTIEQFFGEHKLLHEVPFDLLNLIRKSVTIEKHMAENKKDMTAKRGLQLTVSKIRRLVKYYHKAGKLSKDWKYTSERAALLIK